MSDADVTPVESPLDHVRVLEYDNGYRQFHHDTPEADRAEAGFDLTDFGSAETFEKLLAALDLPADENPKLQKDPTEDRDNGLYVWANDSLALITANNPITGTYSDPEMRHDEEGYASYIGLSGTPAAVDEAYEVILDRAEFIKDRDPDRRQFV